MQSSNITIPIAFAAGFLSFISPCVLPLVPGYISLISGVSIDRLKGEDGSRASARRAVILNSLAFNVGLSMIFVSLGAAAGWIGSSILTNQWVRLVGGLVIIAFGLQLIGLLKIGALYKDTRFFSQQKPRGMFGSLTLGMAFAAGWTPCIGPILGGIIGLAATSGGWRSGLLLSSFYAAGLSLPFLITGLSINQFLGFYSKFRKHLHKVEVVSGVMLMLIGFMVAANYTTRLASWFSFVPSGESLVKFEPPTATDTGAPAPPADTAFAPAPDFTLTRLGGQPLRLSELRGRVVMLNFWATWCGPCRAEIPELNAMQREMKDQGLTIVGVSWDDTAEGIQEFQKELPQDYTILLGGEDVQSMFGGIPSLPTTYIIDRDGRIRQKIIGARGRPFFEAAIKPLLVEEPVTARNQ
ncbi:MAG TPA: cytochrome c biogenesis protein/redoxin [Pyrinomonadaceae bacterium]|jgi:cytochrome c-type biogenesis protein|nr:cytochrome c biogenesis protein/redoxin [Pyrinomonadaceae bacterium]